MMTPAEIAALRDSMGLTLEAFGLLVGVTKGCVHHWESGKSHPTYDKMEKLNGLADKARAEREGQPA